MKKEFVIDPSTIQERNSWLEIENVSFFDHWPEKLHREISHFLLTELASILDNAHDLSFLSINNTHALNRWFDGKDEMMLEEIRNNEEKLQEYLDHILYNLSKLRTSGK